MLLSPNFHKFEFDSKNGDQMPYDVLLNCIFTASQLEILRAYLNNSPITINSGYRSPQHNTNVGGVPNSEHLNGNAVDITVKNHTPLQVYNSLKYLIDNNLIENGGLGIYDNFVHYDTARNGRRWDKRTIKNDSNEKNTKIPILIITSFIFILILAFSIN